MWGNRPASKVSQKGERKGKIKNPKLGERTGEKNKEPGIRREKYIHTNNTYINYQYEDIQWETISNSNRLSNGLYLIIVPVIHIERADAKAD